MPVSGPGGYVNVLEKLRQKNIDSEFCWTAEGFSIGRGKTYRSVDLVILWTIRFESASDPWDMEILYVIRAQDGVTGYSLDTSGAYSSHENEAGYDYFIRMIPVAGHNQQMAFEL